MSTNGKRKGSVPQGKSRRQPVVKVRPFAGLSRFKLPPHVTRRVAYVVIGLSVLLSWLVTPMPAALGLTILAVVRLWIFFREERKERETTESEKSICASN